MVQNVADDSAGRADLKHVSIVASAIRYFFRHSHVSASLMQPKKPTAVYNSEYEHYLLHMHPLW
jgi:hypothetical protein